ncbi:MAG: PrsW family intramembrane metalloprotease [Verrucomicrobiaceae bacterium]|nr:PrsW family intramembrane metalloprotease [Verrucomicrobiaceae bacterium]
MSSRHRTRLFRFSRDIPFLLKCAIGVSLLGLIAAWLIVKFEEPDLDTHLARARAIETEEARIVEEQLENLKRLLAEGEEQVSSPRVLLKRVHVLLETTDLETDDRRRIVVDEALNLVRKSGVSEPAGALISDYIVARLGVDESEVAAAAARIRAATEVKSADGKSRPLSQQITGYLFLAGGDLESARRAFQEEGRHDDASLAREEAVSLALEMEDAELLRRLIQDSAYRQAIRVHDRHRVGVLVGDAWLQWTGILLDQWATASSYGIALGLLASTLWFVVLVRHGDRTRWRWVWPVLPVLAGVASIWCTLLLLDYQEQTLGMRESDVFPDDLIYEVIGVGAREEVAKLLGFCLFLPWLLRRRDAGLATLTGAFVGLGFSLEENIGYISAGADTWGRLLTASFLHVALTGMTGHALYTMIRTRFGSAGHFLATLVGAVVLHGLYNWAPSASSRLEYAQDLDLISLVLLAALAHQFYSLVALHFQRRDGMVSTVGIFVIGSGVLIASGFVLVALNTLLWAPVTQFGIVALGYVPIAVFHVRQFGQQ